jgi:hypothetical protein
VWFVPARVIKATNRSTTPAIEAILEYLDREEKTR